MKNSIIFLALLLASCTALSQDIITTTDGDKIHCKVERITKKKVKYRLIDGQDTSLHSYPKEDVYRIKYEDGEKIYMAENMVDDVNDEGKWNKNAMKEQGVDDAGRQYHGYGGAKTGTAITAALTGPIIGLVPAIICSSTPPSEQSLGHPDRKLMKNDKYSEAYRNEAHRIKSRKVWNGYLVGVVIDIVLTILLIAL